MTTFKSIVAAGLIAAATTLTATGAHALFLSGTFEIEIYNYNPDGSGGSTRRENSAATPGNFTDISSGSPTIGTLIESGSVEWTGALNFSATPGADISVTPEFQPSGTTTTTIADFFASGSGSFTSGTGLGTLAGNTLSAGGGSNDGGTGGAFKTATLFMITAKSLNIPDLSKITQVTHDDGITLTDGINVVQNTTLGIDAGPTGKITTLVDPALSSTAGLGDFVLYYAAANGDPSVLKVSVVPLPAAAWLLLGVSGALVAAKRRKARNAAA